jgi:hypothetical protein
VSPQEAALCHDAGRFDWAYLGATVLADAGTVALDAGFFQGEGHAAARLVGPSLVGFTWGWTVGGFYLTLPHCSPDFVHTRPPEGSLRSELPLAISFSVLAAATAPLLVGIETGEGTQTLTWAPGERVMRLVLASATGTIGSVMPYLLPPRTWRAWKKLHVGAGTHGAAVSYALTF